MEKRSSMDGSGCSWMKEMETILKALVAME